MRRIEDAHDVLQLLPLLEVELSQIEFDFAPDVLFAVFGSPSGIGITTVCGGALEPFSACGLLSGSAADLSVCAEVEPGSFAALPVFCSIGFCWELVSALPVLSIGLFRFGRGTGRTGGVIRICPFRGLRQDDCVFHVGLIADEGHQLGPHDAEIVVRGKLNRHLVAGVEVKSRDRAK